VSDKPKENAESLAEALGSRGHEPVISGAGLHWKVEVAGPGNRSSRTHCFDYGAALQGVRFGLNPGNARVATKGPAAPPRTGPEYLVKLRADEADILSGRTPDVEVAATAIAAWAGGRSMGELVELTPFIGVHRRTQEDIVAKLDPSLRCELRGDPGFHIWVYGDGRSCRITWPRCSFLFGPQEIGTLDGEGVIDAVHAWVRDGLALHHLPGLGVVLERHAEHIEAQPARWHWLHMLDRSQNEDDVLARLSKFIVQLAASPVISRFYSFSSLNRLCFSASSHYPWVGDFPMVAPVGELVDGETVQATLRVSVDGVEMDTGQALEILEAALRDSKVEPFWGSEVDLEFG